MTSSSESFRLIVASGVRRKSEQYSLKHITHYVVEVNPDFFKSNSLRPYEMVKIKNNSLFEGVLITAQQGIRPGEIYVSQHLRQKLETPVRAAVMLELNCKTGLAKSVTISYELAAAGHSTIGRGLILLSDIRPKAQDVTSIKFASYLVGRPVYIGFELVIEKYVIRIILTVVNSKDQ